MAAKRLTEYERKLKQADTTLPVVEWLTAFRQSFGSQRAFADKLGISRSTVEQVERGLSRMPLEYIKKAWGYMKQEEQDEIMQLISKQLRSEIEGDQ